MVQRAIALSMENSNNGISDQMVCLPENNAVLLPAETNNGICDQMVSLSGNILDMVPIITEDGVFLNQGEDQQKEYHELLPLNIEFPEVSAKNVKIREI